MRLLSPAFVAAYPHRILNIHPSLLPAFPGVDAQAQALAYGSKVTGCTVHFVDGGVDSGPVIAQRAMEIFDSDTRDSLAARLLTIEHTLLVDSLTALAREELRIVEPEGGGRRRVVRVLRRQASP